MTIEQLNKDYGIADQLKFVEGKGGFPVIEINNKSAKALISVYSAHILSFQPATETEDLIFLSENAIYQQGKAIRGGIPLCWPWFGPDPEGLGRSNHGFARNRFWKVCATEGTTDSETKVKLGLVDTAETREIWSKSFNLAIEITVGDTLTIELITSNTGDQAFSISQALHTYFKVGDIDRVKVLGLEDTKYIDKVDNGIQKTQQGAVAIAEEVDRIYTDIRGDVVIDDAAFGRQIRLSCSGSKTTVVWNPWADVSAKMADLAEEDYRHFICVETVNAANDVVEVLPGQDFRLLANYKVER